MARQARKLAVSGIYHVMVRGIGRQALFHSAADNLAFLSAVTFALQRTQVQLLNYCLMSNHVHLMLKLRQEDRTSTAALSQCLKIMETRYAAYYNNTYEREGPLFTGRFASEPIDDEHYLLAAWCYVLRNPAKAGIAETDTYTWSSYSDYFGSGHPYPAVDTSYMLTRYSKDFLLQQISSLDDPEGILEPPTPKKKCSDTDVVAKMDRICGCTTPSAFQTLSPENRARSLAVLVQQGAGVRQLARLTGIAPGMISRHRPQLQHNPSEYGGDRMIRTLPQILAQIRQDDPNTSITYYALRNMCVKNEVPYCRVGNRYLVDMDVVKAHFHIN